MILEDKQTQIVINNKEQTYFTLLEGLLGQVPAGGLSIKDIEIRLALRKRLNESQVKSITLLPEELKILQDMTCREDMTWNIISEDLVEFVNYMKSLGTVVPKP